MPDMAYSRALETYAKLDSAKFTNNPAEKGEGKIYYTAYPVAGAMARGDELPFAYAIDKPGDTTNYIASKQVINPLPNCPPTMNAPFFNPGTITAHCALSTRS